jgi:hypothetical protein
MVTQPDLDLLCTRIVLVAALNSPAGSTRLRPNCSSDGHAKLVTTEKSLQIARPVKRSGRSTAMT